MKNKSEQGNLRSKAAMEARVRAGLIAHMESKPGQDGTQAAPRITPPLGIMPCWLHDQMRRESIHQAIERFKAAGRGVPPEWLDELTELYGREGLPGGVAR